MCTWKTEYRGLSIAELQICQHLQVYQIIEKSREALYLGGWLIGCLVACWAEIRDVQQSNLPLVMGNESNNVMM